MLRHAHPPGPRTHPRSYSLCLPARIESSNPPAPPLLTRLPHPPVPMEHDPFMLRNPQNRYPPLNAIRHPLRGPEPSLSISAVGPLSHGSRPDSSGACAFGVH
jgi:hypothetical protein